MVSPTSLVNFWECLWRRIPSKLHLRLPRWRARRFKANQQAQSSALSPDPHCVNLALQHKPARAPKARPQERWTTHAPRRRPRRSPARWCRSRTAPDKSIGSREVQCCEASPTPLKAAAGKIMMLVSASFFTPINLVLVSGPYRELSAQQLCRFGKRSKSSHHTGSLTSVNRHPRNPV